MPLLQDRLYFYQLLSNAKNKKEINEYVNKFKKILCIQSKIDIVKKPILSKGVLHISSKTGGGINILLDKIHKKIYLEPGKRDNVFVSRERHRQILVNVNKCLVKF